MTQGAGTAGPKSERPRCARHGLTLGPEGQCLLCRKEQTQRYAPPPAAFEGSRSPLGRIVQVVLALVALASIGALVALKSRTEPPVVTAAVDVPARDRARSDPARAVTPAATPEPPAGVEQAPADPSAAQPQPEIVPAAQPPTAVPAGPTDAERAAAADRMHEEVMAAIAARDRARAASSVTITMYSTSWCGACKAARAYFQGHGIAYSDRDVEHDADAKAEQLRLNPRGSVPTIDIDGSQVLVGFSAAGIENAIARASAKRAGG